MTAEEAVFIFNRSDASWNGINKLYSQLLAAKLNIASGIDSYPIAATIYEADEFLGMHNADEWRSLNRVEKRAVINWMETLVKFNSG